MVNQDELKILGDIWRSCLLLGLLFAIDREDGRVFGGEVMGYYKVKH